MINMKIEVKIIVSVDDGASMKEVKEWVEFELGYNCTMKMANPMSSKQLEAKSVDIDFNPLY